MRRRCKILVTGGITPGTMSRKKQAGPLQPFEKHAIHRPHELYHNKRLLNRLNIENGLFLIGYFQSIPHPPSACLPQAGTQHPRFFARTDAYPDVLFRPCNTNCT